MCNGLYLLLIRQCFISRKMIIIIIFIFVFVLFSFHFSLSLSHLRYFMFYSLGRFCCCYSLRIHLPFINFQYVCSISHRIHSEKRNATVSKIVIFFSFIILLSWSNNHDAVEFLDYCTNNKRYKTHFTIALRVAHSNITFQKSHEYQPTNSATISQQQKIKQRKVGFSCRTKRGGGRE